MLEAEFPKLPGHVRAVTPEIRSISKSEREFKLLVELAKSAKTRNLIGTVLKENIDIESRVRSMCGNASYSGLVYFIIQVYKYLSN